MAELLDIFDSLKTYLESQLTVNAVKFSFRDERVDVDNNYPEVTINLIDSPIDPGRRYGGYFEYEDTDAIPTFPDAQVVLKKVPIPINLTFQIDTFCTKQSEDIVLINQMMAIMGGRINIPGPDGSKLQIHRIDESTRTAFTDLSLIQKSYRLFIPIWIEHPVLPREVYIVKRLELDLNTKVLIYTEP